MSGQTHHRPEEVLDFWFAEGMERRWFRSTPALDDQIRQRFEGVWRLAKAGGLNRWSVTADGALALIIVLDQFPLNMFRDQPQAFASEAQAIAVCKRAVCAGLDRALPKSRVAFLYMPLMHSESISDQEQSVGLFEAAGLDDNLRFARHHRDLIQRFGRFPHRNAILGRVSTAAEIAYLESTEAFTG